MYCSRPACRYPRNASPSEPVTLMDLNKILPWLSIRSKLIIAFVGLSILPVILVGVYGIYSNVQTMKNTALENLTHDVYSIRDRTGNFLVGVKSDLLVLQHSSLLEEFTNKLEMPHAGSPDAVLGQLGVELLRFAQTKNIYYQIRIVNEQRNELLRVERSQFKDSTLHYYIVPPEGLHEGGESFYFVLTEGLGRGQIVFSPAELVYQQDQRVPIISFAMPLYAANHRVGLLVANVFAKDLFQIIETKRRLVDSGRTVLVNGEGHYLYHSEKKKDWNKLLASRENDNLHHDYPEPLAAAILSGNEGTVEEGIDDIIAYAPLFSSTNLAGKNDANKEFIDSFFVFESVAKDKVLGPVRSFAWTFAGFLFLFLVGAVGLGLLATRQFTKPIAELEHGAGIIAQGNYGHRLDVHTGDEIERLASQFNSMASSLEEREMEIQAHRAHLEEMVNHRTRELVDEKAKLQAILDNVPSAFVLLDKHFQIVTASAAFAAITGLHPAGVLGKDCRVVLRSDGFCKFPEYGIVPAGGKIEAHTDRSVNRVGVEQFIEHITIPMLEGPELRSFVVIISDITRRKRLEQQLIQSEKLMATGEMSAIIAHEFRNALTSIKMILQLQHESKHLSPDNRRSLGVALDSIFHMESIVKELLTFARPSPMEFRVERIETLVNECLSFVQMRIQQHHIALRMEIASELPLIRIDAPHFKEALINILLNSIQAIESNAPAGAEGEINVYARRIVLAKTLRDFAPLQMRDNGEHLSEHQDHEIVLRKGAECVLLGVADTGPGIERDLLRRIFDPFFTTKTNGTGLGLPMVKRTINAHGGIVVVKSSRGKGAAFELLLPLHEDPVIGVSPQAADPGRRT